MEWKAHLKSSSLESESRLDALNFFFAGLLRKPNCHLGVEKTKGSVKIYIRMSSMRQLITNEPQHWLLTLELTQWSKNYLARKNGFSRFLHSFIPFHDIGWGKNWTFSCSCLLQFFEYLSRVTENLAKFACNRHDFLMGSTKCGVITTTTRLPEKIHIKQLTLKISFKDLQMSPWP